MFLLFKFYSLRLLYVCCFTTVLVILYCHILLFNIEACWLTFSLCLSIEIGSHYVDLAGLELSVKLIRLLLYLVFAKRLRSSPGTFCADPGWLRTRGSACIHLCLPNDRINSVHHCAPPPLSLIVPWLFMLQTEHIILAFFDVLILRRCFNLFVFQ